MKFDTLYSEILDAVEPDEELSQRIREFANSNILELEGFLRNHKLSNDSHLFEVYEALLAESSKYSEILSNEFGRLLSQAEADTTEAIYNTLEVFALADSGTHDILSDEIRRMIVQGMKSNCRGVRQFSAYLAGDLALVTSTDLIQSLIRLVKEDPNWRVRCVAHQSLNDLRSDSIVTKHNFQLGFGDTIRKSIFSKALRRYAT